MNVYRKSRLPVGRPSTTGRASSATRQRPLSNERLSIAGSSLRRYGSDTYLNTPNYMMTPMSKSPSARHSVVPESSRRAKHENSLKVQEILRSDDRFYAELNLQSGLKSMTSKQFLLIISYFVKSITGKDIAALFPKGDPLDGIIKLLRDLGCPYIINKSMLRTPNAPHTFDQIVVLMLWLSEYITIPRKVSDVGHMSADEFTRDEQLPNQEYTARFSQAMQKGFQLWNSESDEFAALQDQLVDDFIAAKLGDKVGSANELNDMTDRLKAKTRELENYQIAMPDEQYFVRVQNEFESLDQMKKNLWHELDENRQTLDAIGMVWKTKEANLKQKQEKLKSIKQQIAMQCVTVDEFKELSHKIAVTKNAVSAVEQEVQLLRDEEVAVSTLHARLLKKVSDAIPKLNQHSKQIIEMIDQSQLPMVDRKQMDGLFLKPNPTMEQIDAIDKRLGSISTLVNIHKHATQSNIKKANDQLELLRFKENAMQKELQKLRESFDGASTRKQTIEKKIETKERKFKETIAIAIEQLQKMNAEYEEIETRINDVQNRSEQLMEENEKILAGGEKKMAELKAQKEQILDEMNQFEKELDEKIAINREILGNVSE